MIKALFCCEDCGREDQSVTNDCSSTTQDGKGRVYNVYATLRVPREWGDHGSTTSLCSACTLKHLERMRPIWDAQKEERKAKLTSKWQRARRSKAKMQELLEDMRRESYNSSRMFDELAAMIEAYK